eukprot:scaffold220197_cov24-Tisochrysis_lutea.AAC.3
MEANMSVQPASIRGRARVASEAASPHREVPALQNGLCGIDKGLRPGLENGVIVIVLIILDVAQEQNAR